MTAAPEIHVVDDDPAVRDSLRMLLEAAGHAVLDQQAHELRRLVRGDAAGQAEHDASQ